MFSGWFEFQNKEEKKRYIFILFSTLYYRLHSFDHTVKNLELCEKWIKYPWQTHNSGFFRFVRKLVWIFRFPTEWTSPVFHVLYSERKREIYESIFFISLVLKLLTREHSYFLLGFISFSSRLTYILDGCLKLATREKHVQSLKKPKHSAEVILLYFEKNKLYSFPPSSPFYYYCDSSDGGEWLTCLVRGEVKSSNSQSVMLSNNDLKILGKTRETKRNK